MGIVNVVSNPSHGIKTTSVKEQICFNSLAELPFAVERMLIALGITLHHGDYTRKLYQPIIDLKRDEIVSVVENPRKARALRETRCAIRQAQRSSTQSVG